MLVHDGIETLQSPKLGIGKVHLKYNSKKSFDLGTDGKSVQESVWIYPLLKT